MNKVFANNLFEWIRSGMDADQFSLTSFGSGFRLNQNPTSHLPTLYFFLPDCESTFANDLTTESTMQKVAGPDFDEHVEVFTHSPTFEIKKLLRLWNATQRQTLFGMYTTELRCSQKDGTEFSEGNDGDDADFHLQALTENQINDYLWVQESQNQEFSSELPNERLQNESLRQNTVRRLGLPYVHQYLLMHGPTVVGAAATLSTSHGESQDPTANGSLALFDLTILPGYRGKRFGQKAIEHLHRLAANSGLSTTVVADEALVGFYEKLGFEKKTSIQRWSNST